MLERIIANWSRSLAGALNYDQDQEEVLYYAMTITTTSILGMVSISLVGWLLGALGTTLAAALSAGVLRLYTGGPHASSPLRCNLIGIMVFPLIGWLVEYNYLDFDTLPVSVLALAIAALTIWLYAPAEAPGKPIQTMLQKSVLKRNSYLVLVGWYIIFLGGIGLGIKENLLLAASIGVIWQGIIITPLGYIFMKGLDRLLNYII